MPMPVRSGFPYRRALAALALLLAACSAGPMAVISLEPNSLQLGMVAHWPCDAEGGVAMVDSSGNGHDGTLSGVTWVGGRFDGAMHFDADGSVTVPSFPQATASWSVALWYRAPAGDYGDNYLTLIGNEHALLGGWEMSVLLSSTDSEYRFAYPIGGDAGNAFEHFEAQGVEVDTWVHLAAVVNGKTMRLSFYENGALVGGSALSHLIQPGNDALSLSRWSSSHHYLVGDLDDIVIFNRALVQAEVQELRAQPAPDAR